MHETRRSDGASLAQWLSGLIADYAGPAKVEQFKRGWTAGTAQTNSHRNSDVKANKKVSLAPPCDAAAQHTELAALFMRHCIVWLDLLVQVHLFRKWLIITLYVRSLLLGRH